MIRIVDICEYFNPGVFDPDMWWPPCFRLFIEHSSLPGEPPLGVTNNDEPP